MRRKVWAVILTCAGLAGCVPEETGPDAVCQWPGGDGEARHLSRDADRAENLAIRYADGHARPNNAGTHTIPAYRALTEQCMTALFGAVAAEHHVSVEQVRESVGKDRSRGMDAAVMLSFGFLYALFANGLARRVWLRYPPKRERTMGILACAAMGPVLSVVGTAAGQLWCFWLETLRVGYGHLVYRVDRIPWGHHIPTILVSGAAIYWACAWLRFRDTGVRVDTMSLNADEAGMAHYGSWGDRGDGRGGAGGRRGEGDPRTVGRG